MKLLESVPNFSEGVREAVIDRIAAAARSVEGVGLLDVERNASHNRSVVSIAGPPEAVLEALVRMCRVAVESIDLNHHRGEHPRMGAVDVIPLVPFGESTVDEAIAASRTLAERLWRELGLPSYYYAQSATRPERRDLAEVRRGEFEGLRSLAVTDPAHRPDVGEARLHPTAGIVAIGARPVLIAFNAYLDSPDVAIAKRIARRVRERDGGLPSVKALGFDIVERHQAQVSMNLVDYRSTPIHVALEAVRAAAASEGTKVRSSEIVGLVPEAALIDAAEHYLALEAFDRRAILERRLAELATPTAGATDPNWSTASLTEFAGALAARRPTPGGGSASALAGALAAALGEMVVAYSKGANAVDPEIDEALRDLGTARAELLGRVDSDSRAYEELRAARKARREAPDDAELRQRHRAALRAAAEVPLGSVRTARRVVDLLERIRGRVKPVMMSDWTTAAALGRAAIAGAAANVEINLVDLAGEGIDTRGLRQELAELTGELP